MYNIPFSFLGSAFYDPPHSTKIWQDVSLFFRSNKSCHSYGTHLPGVKRFLFIKFFFFKHVNKDLFTAKLYISSFTAISVHPTLTAFSNFTSYLLIFVQPYCFHTTSPAVA